MTLLMNSSSPAPCISVLLPSNPLAHQGSLRSKIPVAWSKSPRVQLHVVSKHFFPDVILIANNNSNNDEGDLATK